MTLSNILDNKNNFSLDKDSIGHCLVNFPKQCSDALFLGRNLSFPVEHKVDYIFLCGVGGSALAGDFVKNIALSHGNIPIFVVRDYNLPHHTTGKSLVFILSYSGNTEEALSCYDESLQLKATTVVITSGGKLQEAATKDGIFTINIPLGFQPRMATLHLALPVLLLLSNIELIDLPHDLVAEIYFTLCQLKNKWGFDNPAVKNRAKATALQLYGKIPLIWGSENLTDVGAKNLKNQINETAEMVAFWGSIPEANHNEIMSLTSASHKIALILLRDDREHPRISRRFELCKTMLQDKVSLITEVTLPGNSLLTSLGASIYFGNLVGYYLSVLKGINAEEIAIITSLKARMSR